MSSTTPVDTGKISGRRELQFTSIQQVRRDLDAIERAQGAGTLRAIGNWTPGQNLAHLAAFTNYAYDGYPPEMKMPPALLRFVFKFMKNRFLYKKMRSGVKIPGVKGGTVGADDVSTEEGLARLRTTLDRLEKTAPTTPNAIFGPMTHDEWRNLQLRHCELHLSFLVLK